MTTKLMIRRLMRRTAICLWLLLFLHRLLLVWCWGRISCAWTKLFSESWQGKRMVIVTLLVMKSRGLMYLELWRWTLASLSFFCFLFIAACFLLDVTAASDAVRLCCSLKAGRLRVWILSPSRWSSVDCCGLPLDCCFWEEILVVACAILAAISAFFFSSAFIFFASAFLASCLAFSSSVTLTFLESDDCFCTFLNLFFADWLSLANALPIALFSQTCF